MCNAPIIRGPGHADAAPEEVSELGNLLIDGTTNALLYVSVKSRSSQRRQRGLRGGGIKLISAAKNGVNGHRIWCLGSICAGGMAGSIGIAELRGASLRRPLNGGEPVFSGEKTLMSKYGLSG